MTPTSDTADSVAADPRTREELLREVAELRARLAEPEETLRAIRHGEVDAFVVLEPTGERVYALATEELLRLLRLVTDSMPMLVSYIDRDRRCRFVNRRYEPWLGRPVGEILGARVSDVLGDAYAAVSEKIDQALSGREVVHEAWIRYRDRGLRCLRATYVPHLDGGAVLGLVTFIEDVTERQRATAALRILADAGELLAAWSRGEEKLAGAARLAIPDLADCCLVDLVTADGGSERIVGLPGDPAHQPLLEELQRHPPSWEGESVQARVLLSGEAAFLPVLTSEVLIGPAPTAAAPLLRPESAICSPLAVGGRRLGTMTLLYVDSGRRYSKADVPLACELARRIAVELEKSRLFRELEWANSAKDHFLAALSHELRTPLAPVLAIASRLEIDAGLPAALRSDLQVIRRNVELEARLIDDLLDLTRVTRGKLDLHCERCDLLQVLRQAIETCGERELAERHLALDLGASDHVVWGDPSRLTQVFWNLLHNALKFTPKGAAITVRSFVDDPAPP
ncbi:MAG TPA: PAS domain-containing sensor histidine kinase, partial [Thermoanaerobaculia bacterium]